MASPYRQVENDSRQFYRLASQQSKIELRVGIKTKQGRKQLCYA